MRILFCLFSLLFVSGCSQVRVTDYSENKPVFEAEKFFSGELTAHGVIKNRGGKVIRTFSADIDAGWQNGAGVLDEGFLFNDGEQQHRVWRLTPVEDGSYTGTAGDVIGKATLRSAGNSVFLDYTLRVPYGDGTIDLHVDDRMYLLTDDILLNESVMTRFGIEVGSILLVIIRSGNPA